MATVDKMRMTCLVASILLAAMAAPAYAAGAMTVGQDEGYSGTVLDKITRKWSPPRQLKGNLRLKMVISVDGSGEFLDCVIKKSSGLEALDASACAAARAASPYGAPPYGMPAELFFSFWNGSADSRTPADPATPGADTLDARMASEKAEAANERAKARAEDAAKKSGKKMSPTPVAVTGKNVAQAEQHTKQVQGESQVQQLKPVNQEKITTQKNIQQQGRPERAERPAQESIPAQQTKHAPPAVSAINARHGAIPKAQDRYDEKYDKYLSTVAWKLRNSIYVPVQTPPGLYYATVRIVCDKQGKILNGELLEKSGDETLDKYILQGLKRAGKISPPPADLGDALDLTLTFMRK